MHLEQRPAVEQSKPTFETAFAAINQTLTEVSAQRPESVQQAEQSLAEFIYTQAEAVLNTEDPQARTSRLRDVNFLLYKAHDLALYDRLFDKAAQQLNTNIAQVQMNTWRSLQELQVKVEEFRADKAQSDFLIVGQINGYIEQATKAVQEDPTLQFSDKLRYIRIITKGQQLLAEYLSAANYKKKGGDKRVQRNSAYSAIAQTYANTAELCCRLVAEQRKTATQVSDDTTASSPRPKDRAFNGTGTLDDPTVTFTTDGKSYIPNPGVLPRVDITNLSGSEILQRGKVAVVTEPILTNNTTKKDFVYNNVQQVALGGASKRNKASIDGKDRNHIAEVAGRKGMKIVGGQDCTGAALYANPGEGVQAILVSVDGASFGDDAGITADMAELVVDTVLGRGAYIANTKRTKEEVAASHRKSLLTAHEEMKKRVDSSGNPLSAATAAVSTVLRDYDANGTLSVYLENEYVGDPNVFVLAESEHGLEIFSIVDPGDKIDADLRLRGVDSERLSIGDSKSARAQYVQRQANQFGMSYEQTKDIITQGGAIAHYLGQGDSAAVIRNRRVNLTKEFAQKGYNRVWVMSCSDNAGDKVGIGTLKNLYTQAVQKNLSFPVLLTKYMEDEDADDAGFSMAEVNF